MVTTTPSRRALLTGLLFCLSCIGLAVFLWVELGGSVPLAPQGYRFHALFGQASQLYPGAQARVAGVDVGRVVAVRRRGLATDATIELQRQFAPLHRDATAILRQKTLLGETFVALSLGRPSAPAIADGGMLAPRRVQATQTLDEVLNSFDASTRAHLREVLLGISTVTSGAGAGELNSALGNAGPAAAQLDALISTLDGQRPSLGSLVRGTGTVLSAVSRRQDDLRSLVTAGDQLLATTAGHDRGVTATVRALPRFLSELRLTLAAADRTAGVAAPTLAALTPVAPLVRPALSELLDLSPSLQTLMRGLDPFLGVVTQTLPSAQQLLAATHGLMGRLYPAARDVVPVIAYLSAYRRELVAAMANMGAATGATAPSDAGVPLHYLRTLVTINNESQLGASQRLASNRHNAYFAPGALSLIGSGGLQASDCRNVSGRSAPAIGNGSPPPCRVAPAWLFGVARALFHRLAPASR